MPLFIRICPVRREMLCALHPHRNQDIPNAPDARLPQTTSQGPPAPLTVPATLASQGPRFPPSSESIQPVTVKLVHSASARPNLDATLPAGTFLVLAAPTDGLVPLSTGVSLRRPTIIWNFRCRPVLPKHRALHPPNPPSTLVV